MLFRSLASISEKIGRITAISNLEAKPHLRKNNRIKSIHSSLKIEANSLTFGQVRDVINGKTVFGEQREIQEVKNAYAAYERLSEINPYNIRQLKQFHGIMTKYLVEESGEFRSGEEGVFNGNQCIFMAPPAQLVPQLMDELFTWMKEAKDNVHPLILGVWGSSIISFIVGVVSYNECRRKDMEAFIFSQSDLFVHCMRFKKENSKIGRAHV